MRAKAVQNSKPISEKVGNVTIPIYPSPSGGYDAYTVAWYEDGKRRRKVFADLKEARGHARLVAAKIENQERQVLTLTPEDSRLLVSCERKLKPFSVTLESAVNEYVNVRATIGNHPLSEIVRFWQTHQSDSISDKTLSEVIEEFLAGQKKDGVSADYLAELTRFLSHVAERFQTNIMSITPAVLDEFLRTMNCSAGSRNTYRRKLVALFNFARRLGYLPDKSTAADRTARAKETSREIEIYRPAEMELLLALATDGLKPFLVLCAFCGLRAAEARRLDWREVNFSEGFIEVKASKAKTASRRLAPLPENAVAWLHPFAKPEGTVVELSRLIHALQRLGKRVNKTLTEKGKKPMKMPRNALRHSFVSYRLAAIQSPNQTALEAGHDVKILFRHYRELVTKTEAEKWFAIQPLISPANIVPIPTDSPSSYHVPKAG